MSRNFIAPCIHRGYMAKALFYRISMMIGGGDRTLDEIRRELVRLWNEWGYQDASGKDIIATIGFVKIHGDRVPRTSAELRQKLPMMQEVQPQHLRNTPYPVTVGNRSEEFFFKEDCKVQ